MQEEQKAEVPVWIQPGLDVWIEQLDSNGNDILNYVEGKIQSIELNDKYQIPVQNLEDNEVVLVNPKNILERETNFKSKQNLSDLEILNNAELLRNIKDRYEQDYIYCFCGTTLIVVNPYKKIEREVSENKRKEYIHLLKQNNLQAGEPHNWLISALSWQNLFIDKKNQAICISGESGAGKTESTKQCLQFITQLKSDKIDKSQISIENQIMICNPLLECFGNSKTIRNDNSSRFGKYTNLYIDIKEQQVKGAAIQNYLLEKSRITNLADQERNFHIFYAMLQFMPKEKQKELLLIANEFDDAEMSSFNYLNQSSVYQYEKINDQEFYEESMKALDRLNFTENEKNAILKNLAIILFLGNFKVDQSTYVEGQKPCTVIKNSYYEKVIKLLQCDEDVFQQSLTHKLLIIGNQETKSPLQPSYVQNTINSLAREIYNRMFNWICMKINKQLMPKDSQNKSKYLTIGVLDIFGFEIFKVNSIEQLLINYANEQLQGLYIDYIFKNEFKLFEDEGLKQFTKYIIYKDNSDLLKSLDCSQLPPGIFDLLEQSCLTNKTDENFLFDITKQHKESQYIFVKAINKDNTFFVKHTARDVEYHVKTFVEKNKDELSLFLNRAIQTSDKDLVGIFNQNLNLEIIEDNQQKQKSPKEKYLDFKFRNNMKQLVSDLKSCYCHFIKCIKPNEQKQCNLWDAKLSLQQIQYMGLLDSLKIRKLCYPYRYKFDKFVEYYQDIGVDKELTQRMQVLREQNADFRYLSSQIIQQSELQFTNQDYLNGKTRIFLSEKFKNELDKVLQEKQKIKKEKINLIVKLYKEYIQKQKMQQFISYQSKLIKMAKEQLSQILCKADQYKFKKFMLILKRLQKQYIYQKQQKFIQQQKINVQLIANYMKLAEFRNILLYCFKYNLSFQYVQSNIIKKIKQTNFEMVKQITEQIHQQSLQKIENNIQNQFSVIIQSSFRQYVLRKSLNKKYGKEIEKQQKHNQEISAINIQKNIRRFLQRRKYQRIRNAAKIIQNAFLAKLQRDYYLKMKQSAILIQRKYRGFKILQSIKQQLQQEQNQNEINRFKLMQNFESKVLFIDNLKPELTPSYLQELLSPNQISQQFKNNYSTFIKKQQFNISNKAGLQCVVLDINPIVDTTDIYPLAWSREFSSLQQKLDEKEQQLIDIEVGDSFTFALSNDRQIYVWGMNDYNQCGTGKNENEIFIQCQYNKLLSSLNGRLFCANNEQGMIIDHSNNIYVWGKNQNNYQINENDQNELEINKNQDIYCLDAIQENIKNIKIMKNNNYFVTEEGKVIEWNIDQQNIINRVFAKQDYNRQIESRIIPFPEKVKIKGMDVGLNFIIFLEQYGTLYSMGNNRCGQLGLNDRKNRDQPVLISSLKDQKEYIQSVSCGCEHVVCLTTSGKVYAWGNNNHYQIINKNRKYILEPMKYVIEGFDTLRCKARDIAAGYNSIFLLFSNKQVYYSGQIGLNKEHQNVLPKKLNYEQKYFNNKNFEQFIPIRIFSKWSKTINITYLVFADLQSNDEKNNQYRVNDTCIDNLIMNWENDQQAFPTEDEVNGKYFNVKYLQPKPQQKNKKEKEKIINKIKNKEQGKTEKSKQNKNGQQKQKKDQDNEQKGKQKNKANQQDINSSDKQIDKSQIKQGDANNKQKQMKKYKLKSKSPNVNTKQQYLFISQFDDVQANKIQQKEIIKHDNNQQNKLNEHVLQYDLNPEQIKLMKEKLQQEKFKLINEKLQLIKNENKEKQDYIEYIQLQKQLKKEKQKFKKQNQKQK